MKRKVLLLSITIVLFAAGAFAQSQKEMLYSKDPKLAKNKQIVYDFWRSVLEGGHLELAPKYMLETYIQHNPNVPTGRQGFLDFFSKFAKALPIADTIKENLISIVAEGDLVVLSFKEVHPDPKDPTKTYVTTSFEMLRIENGKFAEHWDSALKQ
jgi:predicted SnoaL-like aldol condensation-catalyzing enzyme